MKYNKISYIDKLEQLQKAFEYSTKLAEAIGVSRRTLPNWRDKPDSIKPEHRLDIDVLYCKHFLIPEWDRPKQAFNAVLLPDDMPNNEALFLPRYWADLGMLSAKLTFEQRLMTGNIGGK